ncbi:MAG: hypothetical protein HXY50_07885 [Ignavibacteriaceae bacterium]|nr:hypothetical protein [Ignavibacteriaceae bacterium]
MHRRFIFFFCINFQLLLFGQDKFLFHTISVPIDYANPKNGKTTVSYEFGRIFDSSKPTVFIIADAQQFYVRKGAIANLQETLFDTSYNVLGIIGRNNNSDLKNLVTDTSGNVNWEKAYTVYSWQQYVNDINEVRKKIVGNSGHIYLYGQSGGGFLIHQFLSLYGQYVDKAFTGASVNYFLDAELGINHDKFWEETTKADSHFEKKFKQLIDQKTISRAMIAKLFQRQNFFVKPDSLNFERNKLLNILLANDTTAINQFREDYQINVIQKFYTSTDGIPIRVRLFEFIFPLLKNFQLKNDILQPDIENLYFSSLPLIEAYNKNKIQPLAMQFINQHSLKTKVFILAGRWDHTADYRSQIALASIYPNHILFIANDNHTFSELKNNGKYQKLIISFFKSENMGDMQALIENDYRKYRWTE